MYTNFPLMILLSQPASHIGTRQISKISRASRNKPNRDFLRVILKRGVTHSVNNTGLHPLKRQRQRKRYICRLKNMLTKTAHNYEVHLPQSFLPSSFSCETPFTTSSLSGMVTFIVTSQYCTAPLPPAPLSLRAKSIAAGRFPCSAGHRSAAFLGGVPSYRPHRAPGLPFCNLCVCPWPVLSSAGEAVLRVVSG